MPGAQPRQSPERRLRSSIVRGTTASGPGAYVVRRPPGAAVILGGSGGGDAPPTLLVPTSVIDNFNDLGAGESECAFVGSVDPVWSTNDGDTSYVQMRPGDHLSFGCFLLPDGIPEAWFSAPKLQVAATATSDWTDLSLIIRVQNNGDFSTKETDEDTSQPWVSAGTNDYTSHTVNPPLNGVDSAADLYAEYLDANMYIYVEVGTWSGLDTDVGHEVRITEMLVDIS
jgi:hypothetical protein